jgi:hypothetical protein
VKWCAAGCASQDILFGCHDANDNKVEPFADTPPDVLRGIWKYSTALDGSVAGIGDLRVGCLRPRSECWRPSTGWFFLPGRY